MPPKSTTSDFQYRGVRLASFTEGVKVGNSKNPKHWTASSLSPDHLADCGFYFTPTKAHDDQITCFWCNRKEKNLSGVTSISQYHLQHNEHCPYSRITSNLEQFVKDSDKETFWQRLKHVPQSISQPHSEAAYSLRLSTFRNFWKFDAKRNTKVTSKELAAAGFYFSPVNPGDDRVICMYCDCPLSEWNVDDDPLEEHRKNSFVYCRFLDTLPSNKGSVDANQKLNEISPQHIRTSTPELEVEEAYSNLNLDLSNDSPLNNTKTNVSHSCSPTNSQHEVSNSNPAIDFDDFDFSIEEVHTRDQGTIFEKNRPKRLTRSRKQLIEKSNASLASSKTDKSETESNNSLILKVMERSQASEPPAGQHTDKESVVSINSTSVTYNDTNSSEPQDPEDDEYVESFQMDTSQEPEEKPKLTVTLLPPEKRKQKSHSQFSDDEFDLNEKEIEEILNSPKKSRKMKKLKKTEISPIPQEIFDLSNQNLGDYEEQNLVFIEKDVQIVKKKDEKTHQSQEQNEGVDSQRTSTEDKEKIDTKIVAEIDVSKQNEAENKSSNAINSAAIVVDPQTSPHDIVIEDSQADQSKRVIQENIKRIHLHDEQTSNKINDMNLVQEPIKGDTVGDTVGDTYLEDITVENNKIGIESSNINDNSRSCDNDEKTVEHRAIAMSTVPSPKSYNGRIEPLKSTHSGGDSRIEDYSESKNNSDLPQIHATLKRDSEVTAVESTSKRPKIEADLASMEVSKLDTEIGKHDCVTEEDSLTITQSSPNEIEIEAKEEQLSSSSYQQYMDDLHQMEEEGEKADEEEEEEVSIAHSHDRQPEVEDKINESYMKESPSRSKSPVEGRGRNEQLMISADDYQSSLILNSVSVESPYLAEAGSSFGRSEVLSPRETSKVFNENKSSLSPHIGPDASAPVNSKDSTTSVEGSSKSPSAGIMNSDEGFTSNDPPMDNQKSSIQSMEEPGKELPSFHDIEASTPERMHHQNGSTQQVQPKLGPVSLDSAIAEIEALEDTIAYIKGISSSEYELHNDIKGEVTQFIAAMPEEEEEMSISKWVLHNASSCKRTIEEISEKIIQSYVEEFDKVIEHVSALETVD